MFTPLYFNVHCSVEFLRTKVAALIVLLVRIPDETVPCPGDEIIFVRNEIIFGPIQNMWVGKTGF